jgi:hypothetical protein
MDQNIICLTGIVACDATQSEARDWSVVSFQLEVTKGWGAHERMVTYDIEAWGRRFRDMASTLTRGTAVHLCGDGPEMRNGAMAIKAHSIGLVDQDATPSVSGQRVADHCYD